MLLSIYPTDSVLVIQALGTCTQLFFQSEQNIQPISVSGSHLYAKT